MSPAQFANDSTYELLSVAEQHERPVEIVERIINAGEARTHAALDDHHSVGFVHVENRHTKDRARLVSAGGGLGYLVCAVAEGDVALREVDVDVFHFDEAIIGDVGLCQQHVHVSGHTPGNRVDGEADVDTLLRQHVIQLADFVLRLRHSHAISGHHYHFVRCGKNRGP